MGLMKGKALKGSSTKKNLLPKSLILDINGVWYSSFWSEGPKNHLNLKDLVSRFDPRDFEAKWTWDFEARRKKQEMGPQGAPKGPQGTAGNDKALRCSISVAAP